jgi:hypothetical protein
VAGEEDVAELVKAELGVRRSRRSLGATVSANQRRASVLLAKPDLN